MISSGASLLRRGKQNESVIKIVLFPFISQHDAHTRAVTIKNSVILLFAWLPFCCWGFRKSHEGHANMSQLLLFFYIQSQFRCVVLVSGTNFTKGRLKRSKGRNTVVPVASQWKGCGSSSSSGFSLYSLHVCGGVLCRHSSFLQSKDKHMNPLSWKVPEGRRRRRWDLRRDLLLIKSYPTDACSEAPLFFCFFLPHNSNLCYYNVGGGFWSPVLL